MALYSELLLLVLMGMLLEASTNTSISDDKHYHTFKPTENHSSSTEENIQSETIDDSLKLFSPSDPSEAKSPYNPFETRIAGLLHKATLLHILKKYILPLSLDLINGESFQQTENEYAGYEEVQFLNPRAEDENNNQTITTGVQRVVEMNHLCFQNKYGNASLISCGDENIKNHACVNVMSQEITPCEESRAHEKLAYLCFLNEQPNIVVECNKTIISFCSVLPKDANKLVLCQKEKERLCFQEGVGLQSCAEILKLESENDKKKNEFFFPKLHVMKRREASTAKISGLKKTAKFVDCEKCEIDIDLIVDKSKPNSPPEIIIKTKEYEGYNYSNKG